MTDVHAGDASPSQPDGDERVASPPAGATWRQASTAHRFATTDETNGRLFRALIERSSDVTFLIPVHDGAFVPNGYVSPALTGVLGYHPEAFAALPSRWDIVHPDDRHHAVALLNDSYRTPAVPMTAEIRMRHADGSWRWMEMVAANFVGDPDIGAIVLTARDITARKRADEELRAYAAELLRSNRELEDFASVTSHDLKEPLRKILTFGSRLDGRYATVLDSQGRQYLDRMLNATSRMDRLIDDLLTYSRVSTRTRPFKPVDLEAIVHIVVENLESRIEETGAAVEIGPLPTIDADAVQMGQLFQNLLANALKFRKPDTPPRVTISATMIDTLTTDDVSTRIAEIIVADNGVGFDEKYVGKIFTMFERLHSRTEYEGSGVGLAICRRIVERHGGNITAHGSIGEGARFTVTLPVAHISATPVGATASV